MQEATVPDRQTATSQSLETGISAPLKTPALHDQYRTATPFPFVKIDNFLDPEFAREVAKAYPTFETAQQQGYTFDALNQRKKVQISDYKAFPEPVARLNRALASEDFLTDLSYLTGIPCLLPDQSLNGAGMHISGPGGRLDVHVDFNFLESHQLHRRLNLLLYLNPTWDQEWGGHIQLWDKSVKSCQQSFPPAMNRCVIFETSDISFHGVTPISPSARFPRISFATYYYTREAPSNWKGEVHSTVFKARPKERFRKFVLMPARAFKQRFLRG